MIKDQLYLSALSSIPIAAKTIHNSAAKASSLWRIFTNFSSVHAANDPTTHDSRLYLFSTTTAHNTAKMHLMYTLDSQGKRVYTLKKVNGAEVTKSAHPARFSPDDKYSR